MSQQRRNFTASKNSLYSFKKWKPLEPLRRGIAHDFNNILMGIMGHAEIALIDSQKGIRAERNMEQVINACKRAKELVNQILTFSRQTDIDRKPLNAKEIINEVHKLLSSSLPVNIEIKKELNSDSFIIANPIEIYQVLMNLCTNASHAISDNQGTIEIKLEDVTLEKSDDFFLEDLEPGIYQKLEVIDSGAGIEEDVINQVFDPYFTTKQKGVGTGLGLSVVQRIVHDVGGGQSRFKVSPEKEQPSVFIFQSITEIAALNLEGQCRLKEGGEHILFCR